MSANAPQDETPEQKNLRRLRNARRADQRRLLDTNIPILNLERAFDVVEAQKHTTPLAAIASINLISTLIPHNKDNELTAQLAERGNVLIAQLAEQAYRLLHKEAPSPSARQDGSRDVVILNGNHDAP